MVESDPLLSQHEEEAMTHLSNKHAQQKSLQDKRVPLWTCVLALILSSIVASIVTLTLPRVSGQRPYSRLLPGLNLPPLGNLQWTLMANGEFWSLNTTATQESWLGLFPKGHGYVDLTDTEDVPAYVREMASDGSGRYCLAAFHQLHCLHLIYQDYSAALVGQPFKDREHTQHCIEYLRQTIMCAADTNLEPLPSRWQFPDHGEKVDGFGSSHMCRDFDQVFRWAAEHSYDGDPGF